LLLTSHLLPRLPFDSVAIIHAANETFSHSR
jgi:hypothetical protein